MEIVANCDLDAHQGEELKKTAEVAFKAMRELQQQQQFILQQEIILKKQKEELLVLQEEMSNTAAIAYNTMRTLHDKNLELEATKAHLKAQAEMLRISHEELEQITYMATHDLKGPINNIESTLFLVKKKIEYDSISEFLGWIDRSIHQAKGTLADLAQLVQLKKTGAESFEKINLKELLENTLENFASTLEKEGIKCKLQLKGGNYIFFSPVLANSIFFNLIGNAIKYRSMEREGILTITERKAGQHVIITIADNGIGIDLEKHQQELFTMFKRFHSHVDGSGMGLYIVKKIIERAKGSIHFTSQVGEGTTAEISLPLAEN